jgi:hypothetical protein
MKIKLENVRLSFPALFKAEAFKPGDPLKYKATFLVPKDSPLVEKIEKAAIEALNTKFPGKGELVRKQIAGNNNKCCIQDGDLTEYDGYPGCIAISAESTARPLVINTDKSPLVEQDGKPYAGCYVNASIEFFGYDQQGKGLSASLRGVQFLCDGDSFAGGGPASEDEFDDIAEDATADDLV